MKKQEIFFGFFIVSMILLTPVKKDAGKQNIPSGKPTGTKNSVGIYKEPVKVSIASTTAIQGDKGQRPVKVMVYLSRVATERVTVKYSTENGTAKAGVDYVATNGIITFQPGEAAKWITVPIIGEVAADPDENAPVDNFADFILDLSNAAGAIIEVGKAYITILRNIARNPSIVSGNQGDQAVYEVIFSYTGYLSFYGDNTEECGIRKNGIVTLSGLLSGVEDVAQHDDITYTGDLELLIDIDICSATQGNGGDKYCGIRVAGLGKVFTELELIYGSDRAGNFDGRGGYIKIENKDGQFKRTVTGECADQNDDEWVNVPNNSIASVFNGTELNMLVDATGKQLRTLRKGVYSHTDKAGNVTTVEVLRKLR